MQNRGYRKRTVRDIADERENELCRPLFDETRAGRQDKVPAFGVFGVDGELVEFDDEE